MNRLYFYSTYFFTYEIKNEYYQHSSEAYVFLISTLRTLRIFMVFMFSLSELKMNIISIAQMLLCPI
jgi:hypothetical protein